MKYLKGLDKNIIFSFIIVIVYFLINMLIYSCHEPWRDESQAWVLSHNLRWDELFTICSSEGHPVLWFAIVKISILLGIPFAMFSVVSISIMTIAYALVILCLKLDSFTKIILFVSPIFMYYNPVICRVYSAFVLTMILLIMIWNKRKRYPLWYGLIVAILFQTHVLAFGVAIGCLVDMFLDAIKEKKPMKYKHSLALFLACLSFGISIYVLKQSSSSESYINISLQYIFERLTFTNIFHSLCSITNKFDCGPYKFGVIVFLMLFFFLVYYSVMLQDKEYLKKHCRETIVFMIGIIEYLAIIIFIRDSEHIQMSIVLIIILFSMICCIQREEKKITLGFFVGVICIFCLPRTIFDIRNDLCGDYSGSSGFFEIINNFVDDRSVVVLNNNSLSTSVVAYLEDYPKEIIIWDISNGEEYSIHKWGNANVRDVNINNLNQYISEDSVFFPPDWKLFYVQTNGSCPINANDSSFLTSIYGNVENNIWSEYYWLYRVKE